MYQQQYDTYFNTFAKMRELDGASVVEL